MSPFDGWCASLDEVPDEVFAGRLLGDGIAVDPTSGVLFAPCDGEIVTLPDSRPRGFHSHRVSASKC